MFYLHLIGDILVLLFWLIVVGSLIYDLLKNRKRKKEEKEKEEWNKLSFHEIKLILCCNIYPKITRAKCDNCELEYDEKDLEFDHDLETFKESLFRGTSFNGFKITCKKCLENPDWNKPESGSLFWAPSDNIMPLKDKKEIDDVVPPNPLDDAAQKMGDACAKAFPCYPNLPMGKDLCHEYAIAMHENPRGEFICPHSKTKDKEEKDDA